jgi:hypothetical protein
MLQFWTRRSLTTCTSYLAISESTSFLPSLQCLQWRLDDRYVPSSSHLNRNSTFQAKTCLLTTQLVTWIKSLPPLCRGASTSAVPTVTMITRCVRQRTLIRPRHLNCVQNNINHLKEIEYEQKHYSNLSYTRSDVGPKPYGPGNYCTHQRCLGKDIMLIHD